MTKASTVTLVLTGVVGPILHQKIPQRRGNSMYKHEQEMPSQPKQGGQAQNLYGMMDFKSECSDQAYGQAGKSGCKADHAKIKSQHFTGAYTSDS